MPAYIIVNEADSLARALYEHMDAESEFYLLLPCSAETLSQHLLQPSPDAPPPFSLTRLLSRLSVPTHKTGYQQLLSAIDLYARDPGQSLSKELYPAVAETLGYEDWKSVEHSIRRAILTGWQHRDPVLWQQYFTESTKPPSNKVFIAVMAQQLQF